MPLRFAFAHRSAAKPLTVHLVRQVPQRAANDNASGTQGSDALDAALRHFARFGLGAAREARKKAEAAYFAGDRAAYDRWLEVCQVLDRRMAARIGNSLTSA